MSDEELLKKYPAIEVDYERAESVDGWFLYEELVDLIQRAIRKYTQQGGLGQPLLKCSYSEGSLVVKGKRLERRAPNLKRAKILEERAAWHQQMQLNKEQEEREQLALLLTKYGAPMDTRQQGKLYLLTRRDLPVGYQAVQSAHALREFQDKYPNEDLAWHQSNNSIVIVTASDLKEFNKLLRKATGEGIGFAAFSEPDLADQITAVCFVPGDKTKHLLRHCQLLGGPSTPNNPPKGLLDYVHLMKQTPQGNGSVWEHCQQVEERFNQLINHEGDWPRLERCRWLEGALPLPDGLLPELRIYCRYHDIGKPICHIETDRKHQYPDHANVSADIWAKIDGRERITRWIRNDMAVHTLTQEEFQSIPDWQLHRLVGLAEVYANAEMFGGFESDQFKIKLKKVIRNGTPQ